MSKNYNIPFEFVLDYLSGKEVIIKPMFGCFLLYIDNKIYFFLRDRNDRKELNGVWVALSRPSDYKSLAKELPSINQDKKFDEYKDKNSNNKWLLLSAFDDEFESLVIKACDLVLSNDKRIGKFTKGSLSNE